MPPKRESKHGEQKTQALKDSILKEVSDDLVQQIKGELIVQLKNDFISLIHDCLKDLNLKQSDQALGNIELKINKISEDNLAYRNELKTCFNEQKYDLQNDIREITKSQEFISAKFDTFNKIIQQVKTEITELKENKQKIESNISDMDIKIKKLSEYQEQQEIYNRRNWLEFHGIPERDQENTTNIILDACSNLGFPLNPDWISTSYRIPKTNKARKYPSPILVQFLTYDIRLRVYNLRKQITKETQFKVPGQSQMYINENLTSKARALLHETRQFKKARNYKFVWTQNGKVFLRKDMDSTIFNIKTTDDLENIKSKENEY